VLLGNPIPTVAARNKEMRLKSKAAETS